MTRSPDHPMTSPDHPMPKVLLAAFHHLDLWVVPEWFAERLRSEFPQITVTRLASPENFETELRDVEVLFNGSINAEQFRHARELRWIHSPNAAIHNLLFPELVNSNVILTNAREVHGCVVAEHVIALMFALARRIPQSVRFQSKRQWGQELLYQQHQTPAELAGATLGLVGLGSIGRNVAKRASALGVKVIAVRERADRPKPEFVDEVLPSLRLNEMLSQCEYVVLSPPVTPATRGMIGRDQFAAMKRDGYLINVGRGPLVVEGALIEALRERRIAGAALDVFDQEPLPSDSPLWDLENLLITPHTAGMTENMWERHYAVFSENLRRYLAGQPLRDIVDKQAGY